MLTTAFAIGLIAGLAIALVLVEPQQRLDIIGLGSAAGWVGYGTESVMLALGNASKHTFDMTPVTPLAWAVGFGLVFATCVWLTRRSNNSKKYGYIPAR